MSNQSPDDAANLIILAISGIIALVLYFIPTLIAHVRNRRSRQKPSL
jgi:hypothetical protein